MTDTERLVHLEERIARLERNEKTLYESHCGLVRDHNKLLEFCNGQQVTIEILSKLAQSHQKCFNVLAGRGAK